MTHRAAFARPTFVILGRLRNRLHPGGVAHGAIRTTFQFVRYLRRRRGLHRGVRSVTPEASLIATPLVILGYTGHSLHSPRMTHETLGTPFQVVWYRFWLGHLSGRRGLFRRFSCLFALSVGRGRSKGEQQHQCPQRELSSNPHMF